jgi:hypothetical protein
VRDILAEYRQVLDQLIVWQRAVTSPRPELAAEVRILGVILQDFLRDPAGDHFDCGERKLRCEWRGIDAGGEDRRVGRDLRETDC